MSLTCANITNFSPFISKARIVGPGDGKMTVSMNPLNTLSAQSPAPTPPRAELLRAGADSALAGIRLIPRAGEQLATVAGVPQRE